MTLRSDGLMRTSVGVCACLRLSESKWPPPWLRPCVAPLCSWCVSVNVSPSPPAPRADPGRPDHKTCTQEQKKFICMQEFMTLVKLTLDTSYSTFIPLIPLQFAKDFNFYLLKNTPYFFLIYKLSPFLTCVIAATNCIIWKKKLPC